LSKDETRALARRFALPVAGKPDSQDICFVPDGDYARLVTKLRPNAAEPGEIVDLAGRVLGRHEGIIHYTIGQRRGLGLASPEPLFVVRLEPTRRRVVVGPRAALGRDRVRLNGVNWLGGPGGPETGMRVRVKLRAAAPAVDATLQPLPGGGVDALLDTPQQGIAPGQACVFYDGARVLGGGWILREEAARAA
jgi:tRNA-specific 2-thiouridylase